LDEVLRQDPTGRVAVETMVAFNKAIIVGEVTTTAKVDYEKIARKRIRDLGYTNPLFNFTYSSPIDLNIHEQSPEISKGVKVKGAGDQGMMFGFACRDNNCPPARAKTRCGQKNYSSIFKARRENPSYY
jgi:S-adenosylmethionine synthetase